MTTHAKLFSPSGADRWIDCTASPKYLVDLNIQDEPTDAMSEGSAAHALLELCLKTNAHPRKHLGKKFNNTHVADIAMVNAVGLVVQWCQTHTLDGYELQAERELHIGCTGDKGTTDITLWCPKRKHLIVADLKYGKGKIVDPVKNRQMRCYACGTADADKLWHVMERLTLVIWQPRISEEPQVWEDSPKGLRHFRGKVTEIVQTINEGKGIFKPSEKACQWCKAKGQCKAYARYAADVCKLEFGPLLAPGAAVAPSCDSLTIDELVSVYHHSALMAAWIKAVGERLFDLTRQGKVTAMKLVAGKADRQWVDADAVRAMLEAQGFPVDEFAPRKLAGLGVVEGLFNDKAKRAAFMKRWTVKPEGKPTLADAADPRPAIADGDFPALPSDIL